MLLVVDIGNTNIVLGVFEAADLVHSWRIATRRDRTPDEYAVLCDDLFRLKGVDPSKVEAMAISSVVPPLDDCFKVLAARHFGVQPVFVQPQLQKLIPISYESPADVGADRVVNALAALRLVGAPAIVVDIGTATTFDAISAQGEYLGGIIAPGVSTSAEALFLRAAKLPRVEITRPARVIGNSPTASIQSGLFFGYVGLVEGILRRMKEELPNAPVVATGGFADLIGSQAKGIDRIEEDLTLYGLQIFWDRSHGGKPGS